MSLGRWVLGRKVTAGYAVAMVAIVATGLAGMWAVQEARQASDVARRVLVVSRELTALLVDVVDAETGQRGYFLTNDVSYLEPYGEGVRSVSARLDRIDRLVVGDPAQMERLGRLRAQIQEKLGELAATLELQRGGRRADALALVQTNRGRDTMRSIRTLVDEADAAERSRLSLRSAERGWRSARAFLVRALGDESG
jgi:CHASE3 domain sensor protein